MYLKESHKKRIATINKYFDDMKTGEAILRQVYRLTDHMIENMRINGLNLCNNNYYSEIFLLHIEGVLKPFEVQCANQPMGENKKNIQGEIVKETLEKIEVVVNE